MNRASFAFVLTCLSIRYNVRGTWQRPGTELNRSTTKRTLLTSGCLEIPLPPLPLFPFEFGGGGGGARPLPIDNKTLYEISKQLGSFDLLEEKLWLRFVRL